MHTAQGKSSVYCTLHANTTKAGELDGLFYNQTFKQAASKKKGEVEGGYESAWLNSPNDHCKSRETIKSLSCQWAE